MGTLQGNQYIFMIISHSVFLRIGNVSDKNCRENQNTHFMFSFFFFKSCCLWDNVENNLQLNNPDDNMAHVYCMLDT